MGVSTIDSSSSYAVSNQQRPQRRPDDAVGKDAHNLLKAVKSGDKDAIQSAYDALSQAVNGTSSTSSAQSSSSSSSSVGGSDKNDKLSKLLSTVGAALQSGDVSGLAQTLETEGLGGRERGGPGGAGGPPPGGPPPSGGFGGSGGPTKEVSAGLAGLSDSLTSGDLTSAQTAYSSLTDALKSDSNAPDDFTSKLTDIGSALSSGNLSNAQQLFSALLPRGSTVNIAA